MNKKTLRIIIPICLVLIIAGIWAIKNADKASVSPPLIPGQGSEDFALEVTSIELEALKEHELPIIIDFGADSCEPCKEMYPALVSVNAQMQGKAIVKFVDVWKNSGAADGFPVQLIPTQIFINADGSPYVPGGDINIDFTVYNYKETGEHAFTVHQGGLTEEQMLEILADMGVTE